MCLIVLALGQHPELPLIIAANRDEFHVRPTQAAGWWADRPDILGGRDLQAGGSWLAVHRSGRFAMVTNFRDAAPPTPRALSRGRLITDFLDGDVSPQAYLDGIDEDAYAGFNLIVGDGDNVAYLSNREPGRRDLAPGIYGLSNALLDGPWHKVERSKKGLGELLRNDRINESALLQLMQDRERAPVATVDTGHLDFATAHAVSAPFIVMPQYGTRCTTVVLAGRNGRWRFTENRFDAAGRSRGQTRLSFDATPKRGAQPA